jgi:hypothetical protein
VVWDLELGDEDSRSAIHERHGGSNSRGISAPAQGGDNHDIMLWWDPRRGEAFGYEDGWTADGTGFYWSGMGVEGDQRFTSPHGENGRVRDHVANGDRVRLLKRVGPDRARYVAELELESWQWRDGEDRNRRARKMIQFRFRPVGEVVRDPAEPVRANLRQTPGEAPLPSVPAEPSKTALEALRSKRFRRVLEAQEGVGERREAQLVHAFAGWLEEQTGRSVVGLEIPYGVEGRNLRADAYLPSAAGMTGVLFEAKATAARESVRMAVGQLLDYRRYVTPEPSLAMLLPSAIPWDMLELVDSLGIGVVWRDEVGFVAHGLELG